MFWILLTGVVGLLIYHFFVRPLKYWERRGVKQSKPWILFGDSLSTFLRRSNFYDFIEEHYRKFAGTRYCGIYQFSMPTLLIRDPELIKQITVKDFDHFTDHRTLIDAEADKLWGKNLFALTGQKWRDMRTTLSPSFTTSKMRVLFTVISEAAKNFVEHFKNKNEDTIEVDGKDVYSRLANDVIATTAFGIEVNSLADQTNEFYVMGKDITNFGGLLRSMKFLGYMMIPKLFNFLKVPLFGRTASSFFKNLVLETLKLREQRAIVRPDMINLLMEARKGISKYEENEYLDTGFSTAQESDIGKSKGPKKIVTDDDIVSQALIFFFAGFETVSTVLCFATYELSTNPSIQEKLRDEIKNTWNKCNRKLSYDALLSMKYMDMVISETIRKWPATPGVERVCTKPYVIEPESSEEMPVKLEKGNLLMLPIFGIHRDPEYYPNPEEFDPERFSDENKANIQPYTYMPFGLGPRNCIGSRFALLEIKVTLFYLLLSFKIVPSKRMKIPLQLSKCLNVTAEDGFWFELQRIKE